MLPRGIRTPLAIAAVLAGFVTGCVASSSAPNAGDDGDGNLFSGTITVTEDFEAAAKSSYAAGSVALVTGTWNLDDALIGSTGADVKDGARAARIRNSGHVTMMFDRAGGAGTVTVRHARFGSDGNGAWGLFASRDHGATFAQVGATVATTSSTFATATFAVNLSGSVRLELRKLDGGANRIDLDDVTIGDFAAGGAGALLSKHTTLGIPSPTSASDPASFLSVKSGYVVSYNSARKVPNWVSWELNPSYLGPVPRQDDFRTDDTLPASLPQAQLADYSLSGFDRGHMCPSDDRTLTPAANSQTFYLTNMVPQVAANNRGPWERLEADVRAIASAGQEVYVVAGGVFGSTPRTIGSGVAVPDATFKVVVVVDAGQGVAGVTASSRVIGVVMPNDDTRIHQADDWHTFRVSVDAIEAQTGYDFLSDVDPAIQAVVEARVDNQ